MPRLKTESYGSGDQSWLGSAHGIGNARSSVLDISTFTAGTHYPNGYIPSGTAVNAADEKALKPFTGAEGESLGFVLFDQAVSGTEDLNVPVIRHGIIHVGHLPGDFTAPDSAPGFVFVGSES